MNPWDSKAVRCAEWFCIGIVAIGAAWAVVQMFSLALADLSAADFWRR